MHPAPSVILFTVLSGLGFGFLAFLGFGSSNAVGWSAFAQYFVAFGLAVSGLLASVFHLGNPKNAIKAFSQWRSSWLSREGILAVASLLLMGLYALAAIFWGTALQTLGIIGGLLSLATIFSTSMIYAQLSTVPRWNHPLTSGLFLAFALAGGAFLAGKFCFAIAAFLVSGALQTAAWWYGDRRFGERGSTMETATGLGRIGRVRLFEAPHTGGNYLLNEMVYVVGRKHSHRLRVIALLCGFVLPAGLLALSTSLPSLLLVGGLHCIGLFAARWLFFAEAEHVVGLYYGKR
jgi:DMSO reductase anchor subunit